MTKSASRGAYSPVRGHLRGSKFVPLNSWDRGFLLVFHSKYRPRMHRLATVHARDNQPTTNDVTTQPISISASFTKDLKTDQHQSLLVIYPSGFVNTLMQKLSGNIEALPKS